MAALYSASLAPAQARMKPRNAVISLRREILHRRADMANQEIERNKAVALRFKKNQGKPDMPQVEREVLATNYDRVRGGGLHLAGNAKDQGWPSPGMYLRVAFPDRADQMEQVIAEDDRVGLLFRLNATHTANYCGIEPTGKRFDVYELAMLRIRNGQMVEGWFMMDESELLLQLGRKLPQRSDGSRVVPAPAQAGDAPDDLLKKLEQSGGDSREARNKRAVVEAFSSRAGAASPQIVRPAFSQLREKLASSAPVEQTLRSLLSDHRIRIEALIAEGDSVWARLSFQGKHTRALYGIAPTGKPVGAHVVVIATFEGDRWTRMWCLGDELGLLLQMGQPNWLVESAPAA
jgi:predicted ester cyclase